MNKKLNKTLLLTTFLCVFPMVFAPFFYQELPERIAIQWGINGEVTNSVPKLFGLFGLPLIFAVINLYIHVRITNDPKRRNASKVVKAISLWTVPVISLFTPIIAYTTSEGTNFNMVSAVMVFVGIMIVMIGNYLPKCKQNKTVGIKLPWTLKDEENWNKTHHLAGYVWIVGGLAVILNAFLKSTILFILVFLTTVLIPIGYSFYMYRKKRK